MGNRKYDYEDFEEDLFVFADKWVDEIAVAIAERAKKLFENEAIQYMVAEYAKAVRKYSSLRHDYLRSKADDAREIYCDCLMEVEHDKMKNYEQVLYDLLVKREER